MSKIKAQEMVVRNDFFRPIVDDRHEIADVPDQRMESGDSQFSTFGDPRPGRDRRLTSNGEPEEDEMTRILNEDIRSVEGGRVTSDAWISDYIDPPPSQMRTVAREARPPSPLAAISDDEDMSTDSNAVEPLQAKIQSLSIASNNWPKQTQSKGDKQPSTLAAVSEDEDESTGADTHKPPHPVNQILKYGPKDVLFGRGGLSFHHAGNNRYRAERDKLKSAYKKATKSEKTLIRNRLVDNVHGYGGRFLLFDKARGGWVIAELGKARKKASQALRESPRGGKPSSPMPSTAGLAWQVTS